MKLRQLTFITLCSLVLTVSAPAWSQSDPYAAINRLLRAKQYNEAIEAAQSYLTSNPRDPQMRLLLGVVQSESGDVEKAKATYIRLTQEFPELPEPHNNLAALYAQESKFAQARESLEMAVKLNPNYAVAHENLGDIYVRLARESYARAATLDRNAVTIGPKRVQLETVLRPPQPAATKP